MEPFLGQLMLVPYNFAPRFWANCDGQLLAISSNSALFSLIGTIYGGDGETTFALPDLRGRIPMHLGNGPGLPSYGLGQRSGNYQTLLSVNNLPAHNHTAGLNVNSTNASQSAPTAGSSIATPGVPEGRDFRSTYGFNASTPDIALNSQSIAVGNTGANIPFNNLQPYLTMRWVIALVGIYPSMD